MGDDINQESNDAQVVLARPPNQHISLDINPFTADTFWTAGLTSSRWEHFRRIFAPFLGNAFAVTDPTSQAFVDRVRYLLDSSIDPGTGSGVVRKVAISEEDGDADMLRSVLELGAHPDLPNVKGWRAMHACSLLGRLDAAAVVLDCRPDLNALNENYDTPLATAQEEYCYGDESMPGRKEKRLAVANMIGKHIETGFKSIPELICCGKFFAVKNLIRRGVVPAAEITRKFARKSAIQWARAYKLELLAEELEYYLAELVEGEKSAKSHVQTDLGLPKELDKKTEEPESMRRGPKIVKGGNAISDRDHSLKSSKAEQD